MKTITATILLTFSLVALATPEQREAIHSYCSKEASAASSIVEARDEGVSFYKVYSAVTEESSSTRLEAITRYAFDNESVTGEQAANVVYRICSEQMYETYQIEESGV